MLEKRKTREEKEQDTVGQWGKWASIELTELIRQMSDSTQRVFETKRCLCSFRCRMNEITVLIDTHRHAVHIVCWSNDHLFWSIIDVREDVRLTANQSSQMTVGYLFENLPLTRRRIRELAEQTANEDTRAEFQPFVLAGNEINSHGILCTEEHRRTQWKTSIDQRFSIALVQNTRFISIKPSHAVVPCSYLYQCSAHSLSINDSFLLLLFIPKQWHYFPIGECDERQRLRLPLTSVFTRTNERIYSVFKFKSLVRLNFHRVFCLVG